MASAAARSNAVVLLLLYYCLLLLLLFVGVLCLVLVLCNTVISKIILTCSFLFRFCLDEAVRLKSFVKNIS